MEVPVVVDTFIDDFSGVTYYRVRYSDGRLEDMTQQQYEYLKASAEAVHDLDAKESTTVQPEEPPAPAESTGSSGTTGKVQTGDRNTTVTWSLLLLISMFLLIILRTYQKKIQNR